MAYPDFVLYKIIFSKTAEKFLDTLDREAKQKILKKSGRFNQKIII